MDVPDEIDLVNISIAAKLLPSVIEECGKKGVKFAIVHSAGFKEMGPDGIKREQELVAMANSHGIRIFGPNSQGVQNSAPEVSVYANFTFVPMKPGNISILAQSGGVGEMLKLHLHNVGLGHRMYASYGNESDLTMPEILEYYGKDDGTRAIMVQIESFKNPAKFLEVASKITPNKPILAIKAGQTREGSVAVCSHTGSLVDQGVMATAMFRKSGVLEFRDTDEMIKTAIAMSTQEPPPGRRLGLITNTGGPGVQAVDEAVAKFPLYFRLEMIRGLR
jgi:acetyltransferase